MSADAAIGVALFPDNPTTSDFIVRARGASVRHRVAFEGTDPEAVRLPASAMDELMNGLTRLISRQVLQVMLFEPFGRRSRPLESGVWRDLAKRDNIKVERMYLLPAGDNRKAVEHQIEKDRESGLSSYAILMDNPLELATVPMCDTWLIDDQLAVREESFVDGPSTWLVTSNNSEVERARDLWRRLTARRDSEPVAPPGPDLTGQLMRSAKLLYTIAPVLCDGGDIDEENCSWYHSTWQYLRLFDMVSSPSWHSEFYLKNLRQQIIGQGARKILITGCADYTTLAFVIEAARDGGQLPSNLEIHVIDKCRTPLAACRWYADEMDVKVIFHQGDVTKPQQWNSEDENPSNSKFDVIISDAFLTRFSRNRVPDVLKAWMSLLAPSGKLITTIRLHPCDKWRADLETNYLDRVELNDLVDSFELRLCERAAGWRGLLGIDLKELSLAARRYARRITSHNLGSSDDLRRLFNDQRLSIAETTEEPVPGELVESQYLCVVAGHF